MDSSTRRTEGAVRRQQEIRNQIERLQAQLTLLPDGNNTIKSPKRKQLEPPEMLAPATPSPSECAPLF